MDKLDKYGATAYYETTRGAYILGLISWSEVIHRLAFLYSITDDLALRKKLFFIAEEEIVPNKTEDYDNEISETVIETSGSFDGNSHYHSPLDENGVLQLIIKYPSALRKWVFHQHDPDFFPSIPHGHEVKTTHKLDAYLGWIYLSSAQVGRESRKIIIALWNNDQFRNYALDSIHWYLAAFPGFKWRVLQPFRIPKRRRSLH